MSHATALALFGADAVRLALAEPNHDMVTDGLALEVARLADHAGAFRAWALGLPWPRFCAVVRIISGAERREVEQAS